MLHDILTFVSGMTVMAVLLAGREWVLTHGRDAWIAQDPTDERLGETK